MTPEEQERDRIIMQEYHRYGIKWARIFLIIRQINIIQKELDWMKREEEKAKLEYIKKLDINKTVNRRVLQ